MNKHHLLGLLLLLISIVQVDAQNEKWADVYQSIETDLREERFFQAHNKCDELNLQSQLSEQQIQTWLTCAYIEQRLGQYAVADSLMQLAQTNCTSTNCPFINEVNFQQLDIVLKKMDFVSAKQIIKQLEQVYDISDSKDSLYENALLAYYKGVFFLKKSDFSPAKRHFSSADSLLHQTPKLDSLAKKMSSKVNVQLAELYINQEEQTSAKKHLDTALSIATELLPPRHTEIADIYHLYGRLYQSQQFNQQALNYYDKAKAIQLTKVGKLSREYAMTLSNIGHILVDTGEFLEGEQVLQEVYDIMSEQQQGTYWLALPNASLGLALQALGKNEEALEKYYAARPIFLQTARMEELLKVNGHIASIYQEMGLIDSTENLLKYNLEFWKENDGVKHLTYATINNDLGEFYLNQEKYSAAVQYYSTAKDALVDLVGDRHYYYASVLNNLAYTHQKNNQIDLAEKYYLEMEAIDRATIGEQHPDFVYSQYGMANFYALQESPKAEDYFLGANRGQLNLIYDYYSGFDEGTRLSYLKEAQRGFDEFYSYVNDLTDKQNLITEAQNLSLATKGLALDFSVATRLDNATDTTDLQKNWLAKRAKLAAAYGLSKEERVEQNIDLNKLKSESEQLEKDLIRSDEKARLALQQRQRLTSTDLQQKLAKNAASIDIIRSKYYEPNRNTDSIFYYAILHFGDAQRSAQFVQLAEEKQLANLLKSSDGYVKYPQIGEALADLIWQPLAPYLEDIEDIHIAPDGWLHRVAFGALPTENGLVSDKYNLLYYNHLRDFIQNEKTKISQTAALVGGAYFDLDSTQLIQLSTAPQDVQMEIDTADLTLPLAAVSRAIADDSTRSAVRFNYLAGTNHEVQNIYSIFQKKKWQTQLLTGERALEDEVKNLAEATSPNVLHIATHGYFFDSENGTTDATLRERIINADHPLIRSGLVFTGVNHTWQGGTKIKGLDDGVLTALEISNLNLSNTNLVVLSACETGMGDVQGGEGVFGLQRAFKLAGANQLILSLWKIPDAQTAKLMQLFYKEYLKSSSAATALQRAQAKMRKRYEPYYWAGFVLIN